jgi:hypothetical protein
MTTKRKKLEFVIVSEDDRNPDQGWHWPLEVPGIKQAKFQEHFEVRRPRRHHLARTLRSFANSGLVSVSYFDLYNIRAGICEKSRRVGTDGVEGIHAMSGERCSPQACIMPTSVVGTPGRV